MAITPQQITDARLFSACQQQRSITNLLSGTGPTALESHKFGKTQTTHEAPIVQIGELAKSHGTKVHVTIVNPTDGEPRMGLEKRDGYEADISTGDFGVEIGQYHKSIKTGLMIEQQKVGYDKKSLGNPLLATYHASLCDKIGMVQLAGARGTYEDNENILPAQDAPRLDKIMINPITAPTFNRKLYCGSATSVDGSSGTTAITVADKFSPSDTRKFKEYIELMSRPPKMVSLGGSDKMPGTDPMYLGLVTPKMWSSFESAPNFQEYMAQALRRTKGFNHPLFQGEMFMKDNILFKKYLFPIGWEAGDPVKVCADDNAATESEQTAPVAMERGIILGGQALAHAYGSVLPNGMGMFKTNGETIEKDSYWTQWMDWVMGLAKIRFPDSAGRLEDYGVIAFDAAV